MELPFLEQFKGLKEREWPWVEDREEWNYFLSKCIINICINNFMTRPLLDAYDLYRGGTEITQSMDVNELPDMWTLLRTMAFCLLVEEIGFYISHAVMHHRLLYPYVHKVHHESKQVVSVASHYLHPIEYAVLRHNGSMGPYLLGKQMHMWSLICWNIFRSYESIEAHSGYEFPWSPFRVLPFSTSSQYHDWHHSKNVGNYSDYFYFLDMIFETNKDYLDHLH